MEMVGEEGVLDKGNLERLANVSLSTLLTLGLNIYEYKIIFQGA